MKHVHSKDPRKKQITDALKAKSGGNKVTMLKELKDGSFQGNVLKSNGRGNPYTELGTFSVTKKEAGLSDSVLDKTLEVYRAM